MRLPVLVAVLLLVGCERAEYLLGSTTTPAGTAGAAGAQGTGGAAPGLGSFGPPELVAPLESLGIDDPVDGSDNPSMTADRLELYFTSGRPGGPGIPNIWLSTRVSASDPWGVPVLVPELNTDYAESSPAVAPDGLTIWLGSNRPGGPGGVDIYVATRAARGDGWSTPVLVPALSSPADEIARRWVSSPDLMLVSSTRLDGSWDLFTASRPSESAPWEAPVPITELNTPAQEADGWLSADGTELTFTSTRVSANGEDLYVASRASGSGPFTRVTPLIELNSAANERDPWLTEDGRLILFTSARTGTYLIYQAER